MIKFTQGNILTADVEAIVNTVNCVGVMGRGIALQFKRNWPANFEFYVTACSCNEVVPGKMCVFETGNLHNPRFIINFPTKRHWKAKSRIEDIDAGLIDLVRVIKSYKIKSIAIPPLGAGLGGLPWDIVKGKIVTALNQLRDIEIIIYEPLSNENTISLPKTPYCEITPGRAVLIALMRQYLNGLLDPTISLLEVQKLLYFMQEAGEPLKLRYQKYIYGPYADNLRHILLRMEGHFIEGYQDAEDDPRKPLRLKPNAIDIARDLLKNYPETVARFERVARLVDGFESAYGMELLSTVHWAMCHENIQDDKQLIEHIHQWNNHKRSLKSQHILLAKQTLLNQGWIK